MLYPRAIDPFELGLPTGPKAHVYFVDPVNGDDDYSGLTQKKPMKTLAAAEDACVTGNHDTVAYIAGTSGMNLTEALVWDKDYTHLVGLCAPTPYGQRSRIFQTSTVTGASPLITFSGDGCIIRDIYAFQGVDDATSLINVQVTGGRNSFQNVHFAGGGHATQAIDGGASLSLAAAEENYFKGCTIGVDTIAAATGMAGMIVDGASVRNVFDDCRFILYAGNAGAKFVEIIDSAGFDRMLEFNRCLFVNDAVGYTLTEAFTIPSGMGSATHRIILRGCNALGVTDWDTNDRGIVYIDAGTFTAGGNAGLMAASAKA